MKYFHNKKNFQKKGQEVELGSVKALNRGSLK